MWLLWNMLGIFLSQHFFFGELCNMYHMNQETEKAFDVYREVSLYCIYSTPYCTGYCEMDIFQLIWKTKSDLGFEDWTELKKTNESGVHVKRVTDRKSEGVFCFVFCHQKHNNNNKNHRTDGCPLKPINNARLQTRCLSWHSGEFLVA